MSTMKAVRIHAYGNPDQLVYEDAPRPEAGDGELLIRVHATSANRFDCVARAGYVADWYPYPLPHILGLDVSGVVEAVGTGVSGFAPGDEVYARADPARSGAYAEYIAVSAADAAAKPPSLDHLQAAALPHAALTAWRALIGAATLQDGQSVLIHGAAGGVGHIAVQLAKLRGARVIGTASKNNLEFLRELGADDVVDYTQARFEDTVRDVNAVLDTIGDDTQERSWGVLKPGGMLLSLVRQPSDETAVARGVRQQFVVAHPPAGDVLREIAALVEAGQIRPTLSDVLTLRDLPEAHARLETMHTRGKLVIEVAD